MIRRITEIQAFVSREFNRLIGINTPELTYCKKIYSQ